MEYPIICECGQTLHVRAGDAGSRVACRCGSSVVVPPLHELRAAVGQQALSPELMISTLLQEGRLPQEQDCVGCGASTNAVAHVWAECERAEVRKPGWTMNPLALLLGWIWLKREGEKRVLGQDIQFRLPVRLCEKCSASVRGNRVREVVSRVPLYAKLLDKFPRATVSLADR